MAPASPRCCGDHAVASGGSIVRAGIVPGVALEKFKLRTAYVAPHLQTWHKPAMPVMEVLASGRYASIGLNDTITASDRKHAEAGAESEHPDR